MNIIKLVLLFVGMFVLGMIIGYYYMASKHFHQYRYLSTSNGYDWFYCTGCMVHAYAHVNDDGVLRVQYFNNKVSWRKYGMMR